MKKFFIGYNEDNNNEKKVEPLIKDEFTGEPNVAINVVLQTCHSYNIELYKVGEHVQKKKGLAFHKIVTDFSQSDVGQLHTRVEALMETC